MMKKKQKNTKTILLILALTTAFLSVFSSTRLKQKPWTPEEVQSAINHCEIKVLNALESLSSYEEMPRSIVSGKRHWETKPLSDWTTGFWPGILWYIYEGTGNEKIKTEAEKFTVGIEKLLQSPVANHDVGFVFNCSFGNAFRCTNNENYKNILVSAADSLCQLYNPNVGTILSWPFHVRSKKYFPHNTIIDNMMNLELLFVASKLSEQDKYSDIAISHANVTAKNHIRPDNTLYHVLVYDDKNGKCLRKVTHQGYADHSVWARGQAWGIYGYTMCYRETGNKKYKKIANKLAAAYLERLSDDNIPFWDFDDPDIPNTVKDASSAAITASALLELSEQQTMKKEKDFFRVEAEKMLRALASEDYLSGDKNDAILLHSTGNYNKESEVSIPIIYADYYYIEALLRLRNILKTENK